MNDESGAPRQRVRAAGAVASGCGERGGHERGGHELAALHQSGGAKIRLPRSGAHALSAVLLNTAGGLTGGDEIRWSASAGERSRLSVATAASEKVYRTHGPFAEQRTTLAVERGARLDWLPQETILFDGARLRRTLHASLAADARLLVAEALVFGRRASGETLRTADVFDTWRVHRGGELLHAEALRIDDDWREVAREGRALHGVGAVATVLYCAPDGPEALERLADTLCAIIDGPPGETRDRVAREARAKGGASAMDGRVVLRLAAPCGFELRRILLPCLARLQGEAALPRVWHV